jgi:hypothetical protein
MCVVNSFNWNLSQVSPVIPGPNPVIAGYNATNSLVRLKTVFSTSMKNALVYYNVVAVAVNFEALDRPLPKNRK